MASSRLPALFQIMMGKRLLFIHSLQAASLMTIGDVICQTIAERQHYSQINYYRAIKFGSVGLILGPVLGKWYKILDKINTGSTKTVFVKRIALDQLCFAPLALASILGAVSLIDGKSKEEIRAKFERDYIPVLVTNYKVWPVVQSVNFTIVPLRYRVLVTQSVAVVWNAYLSWKINEKDTR